MHEQPQQPRQRGRSRKTQRQADSTMVLCDSASDNESTMPELHAKQQGVKAQAQVALDDESGDLPSARTRSLQVNCGIRSTEEGASEKIKHDMSASLQPPMLQDGRRVQGKFINQLQKENSRKDCGNSRNNSSNRTGYGMKVDS